MPEDQVIEPVELESKATPEVQAQAEGLGWIPPKRFKGDPERYVDADEFIKRGEVVLPIVKAQNKQLQSEVENLRRENERTSSALKAAQDAIDQIEERHTVSTQKAVEAARRQVKEQLAAASEAGDHQGVAELTDQLTHLNAAEDAAEREKKVAPAQKEAVFVPAPEQVAWQAENTWFGQDEVKTAVFLALAGKMRKEGNHAIGARFFEEVKDRMNETLPESRAPASKVEGGRPSGDSGPVGKVSYDKLPAEAKEACDRDARSFVGSGKKYKTNAEWRQRYADIYFGS